MSDLKQAATKHDEKLNARTIAARTKLERANGPDGTEAALAEHLAGTDLPNRLRWAKSMEIPGWCEWNGTYWNPCLDRVPLSLQIATRKALVHGLEGRHIDPKALPRLESASAMRGIATLLSAWPAMWLDAETDPPDLLVCPNGVLHLDAMELRPHDSRLPVTKCTPVAYDPTATDTNWQLILEHLHSLPGDAASIIQRYLGAAACGRPPDRKILVNYGPDGNEGKSTLFRACCAALGSYAGTVPAEAIAARGGRGAHGNELLSAFSSSRLVTISEVPADLNWGLLKSLSGGDPRCGKRMYGRAYTHETRCHIVIITNELPLVPHGDQAARDRLALLRWIRPAETDPELVRVLATHGPERDSMLRAALSWLVAGAAQYRAHGYGIVESAPIGYQAPEGLDAWWEDGTASGWLMPGLGWTPAADVEREVDEWAQANGRDAPSRMAIGTYVKAKVVARKREGASGRCLHYCLKIDRVRTLSALQTDPLNACERSIQGADKVRTEGESTPGAP